MGDSEQPDVPEAEELISQGLSGHKKSSVQTRKICRQQIELRADKSSKGIGTWPYYWCSGR